MILGIVAKPPGWYAGLYGSIPFQVNIFIIFYFHSMMSIHSFIIYILLPEGGILTVVCG